MSMQSMPARAQGEGELDNLVRDKVPKPRDAEGAAKEKKPWIWSEFTNEDGLR
jgi:hypothetical protein